MRNVLIKLVFMMMVLSFTGESSAQNTPEGYTKNFFETFEKNGATMALQELYDTNKWVSKNQDQIISLQNKMEGLTEDYIGKYYGYEFINKKQASDNLVLLSYLIKYDRQPLRFNFMFYKPKDKWVLYSFEYDAGITEELTESARVYYIKDDK